MDVEAVVDFEVVVVAVEAVDSVEVAAVTEVVASVEDAVDSEGAAVEVTIRDHQRKLCSSVSSPISAKMILFATIRVEKSHISMLQFTSRIRNKSEKSTRFLDPPGRTDSPSHCHKE